MTNNVVAMQQRARRAVVVGGLPKFLGRVTDLLHSHNIHPEWHWDMERRILPGVVLPAGCELVLVFSDMLGSAQKDPVREAAKRANVPCIFTMRQKTLIAAALNGAGFIRVVSKAETEAETEDAPKTRADLLDEAFEILAKLSEADPRVAELEAEVRRLTDENTTLRAKAAKLDALREALG